MPVLRSTLVLAALAALASPLAVAAQGSAVDDAVLVPVAARRLPRGTVLTEGDMTVARVAVTGASAVAVREVSPGWVTRRLVRAGEPLRPPAVAPAPLLAARAPVHFVVRRDGFEMSIDGVAVVAASLGDTVPVRLGAKRRLVGVVTGPATVVALDSLRLP